MHILLMGCRIIMSRKSEGKFIASQGGLLSEMDIVNPRNYIFVHCSQYFDRRGQESKGVHAVSVLDWNFEEHDLVVHTATHPTVLSFEQ